MFENKKTVKEKQLTPKAQQFDLDQTWLEELDWLLKLNE